MDKEVVVSIYNGILLSHKKNEILPFAAPWMDLEMVMLTEASQTETNKYHIMSLVCGIEKDLFTKQKQIHRLGKQTCGCPGGNVAGSFQMSQLSASGGQSIGVSASTSVLPMNIQG